MRALRLFAFAALVALGELSQAQTAAKIHPDPASAHEKLIGAWRLVSMEEQGTDGKIHRVSGREGLLIYTRDGHMSVQIMYPASDSRVSNDYVRNGYEASFGSYDVNEDAHTVTHHVEGSITQKLVGGNLPRVYRFSGKRLIIQSARPDEHWSVTWEHY